MDDPEDEALIREILPILDLDHQYTRLAEAWNHELIAQIRRCGREAGKRLGYKIRTLTSDPQRRDDGRVAVWVVVIESTPNEEAESGNEATSSSLRPSTRFSAKPGSTGRSLGSACRERADALRGFRIGLATD